MRANNDVGGGFFNNFAYGATQSLEQKARYQDQYQAEADAHIREKVANIDPEAALYQRQRDIDAQYQGELLKQKADAAGSIYQNLGLSPSDLTSSLNQASQIAAPSVNNPAPTITTPLQTTGQTMPNPFGQPMGGETSAPSMAPDQQTPAQPTAPPMSAFDKAQRLRVASAELHAKGLHDEAAGVEQLAVAQEKQHEEDLRASKVEPTPNKSAEGMNVNEELIKEAKENEKSFGTSMYLPQEAQMYAKPDTRSGYKGDTFMAETVHTPLAQAEMAHQRQLTPDKPEEEVFGLVKNNTVVPTQDIATIMVNHPNITPARKVQAVEDLKSYMESTYGDKAWDIAKTDPNLKKVFTPKLRQSMGEIIKQNNPQPIPANE